MSDVPFFSGELVVANRSLQLRARPVLLSKDVSSLNVGYFNISGRGDLFMVISADRTECVHTTDSVWYLFLDLTTLQIGYHVVQLSNPTNYFRRV